MCSGLPICGKKPKIFGDVAVTMPNELYVEVNATSDGNRFSASDPSGDSGSFGENLDPARDVGVYVKIPDEYLSNPYYRGVKVVPIFSPKRRDRK